MEWVIIIAVTNDMQWSDIVLIIFHVTKHKTVTKLHVLMSLQNLLLV